LEFFLDFDNFDYKCFGEVVSVENTQYKFSLANVQVLYGDIVSFYLYFIYILCAYRAGQADCMVLQWNDIKEQRKIRYCNLFLFSKNTNYKSFAP